MNRSFVKVLALFASLALLSSTYIACGGGDECTKNSDCAKKGKDYICSADKAGKKACVKKEAPKTCDPACAADEVCKGTTCEKKAGSCGGATCAADEKCEADKCVKAGACGGATCAADEECKNDACVKKPTGTCGGATCAADEECKNNACVKKPAGCKAGECPSGQKCNAGTGKCEAAGGCNPACAADEVCKGTTCEKKPVGTKKPGENCNAQAPDCAAGGICLVIDSATSEAVCFQECTDDAACAGNPFRKKCPTVGNRQDGTAIKVCLGESPKDGPCGFKVADQKQGRCKAGQKPPLYCSKANKCAEVVVQGNVDDPCNKQGDNAEPVKICDGDKGLVCDETTGKCKKGKLAKEGEHCDPTGKDLGEATICGKVGGTQMTCVSFSQNTFNSACHVRCDPTKKGECAHKPGTECFKAFSDGSGLCLDLTCTKDTECVYANYTCVSLQSGGKACFPKEPSGPTPFGGVCKDPGAKFGCNTDATKGGDAKWFCLRKDGNAKEGYCSRNCTQDDKCPAYKTKAGDALTAACTQISQQGTKACLFPCGQPGQKCPDGTTCQDISGQKLCFPQN